MARIRGGQFDSPGRMTRKFALKSRTSAGEIDFGGDLNPEQLRVATAPGGPMLVITGAGSGKTRALTYRLAWLVHHGVDPSRIMLVTFTNRGNSADRLLIRC